MQTILERIGKGQTEPIYFVHGSESYLIQRLKDMLCQTIPLDDRELNCVSYAMEEHFLSLALEDADSMSFLGDKKIVFIDNAYFLTTEKIKNTLEHDVTALEKYIHNPNPNTILVISVLANTIDKRKKIVKLLKEKTVEVNAHPLNEQETVQFMQQHLSGLGYTMDRSALALLGERTHYQLSLAMNELEKLCLYRQIDKTIHKKDVEQLVAKSLTNNVFALLDEVQQRHVGKALEIYRELIMQKEEPIKLLALMLHQVRLWLQLTFLQQKGYQSGDMAQALKLHPYRIKLAMGYLSKERMTISHLKTMYNQLIEADYQLKTSVMDNQVIMELTLLKMMEKES